MRQNLKKLQQKQSSQFYQNMVVGCLVSCLTTFQFGSSAFGQGPQASLPVSQQNSSIAGSIPHANSSAPLATPSLLFAPQMGFLIGTSYSHLEAEIQLKNVDGNYTSSADSGEMKIGYALVPAFYFGAGINYMNGKGKADMAVLNSSSIQTTNNEGVSDPSLFVGSRWNIGKISLLGNFDATISTGSHEIQRKQNQVTEVNNRTGGAIYTPSVSLFTNETSSLLMGAQVGYEIHQSRKVILKDIAGYQSEGRVLGGNKLSVSVFSETPTMTHSLGAFLNWSKSDAEKNISPDGSETSLAGKEQLTGTLYGNLKFFKNISIIPALSYYYYMNDKSGDDDLRKQSIYSGGLSVLANF